MGYDTTIALGLNEDDLLPATLLIKNKKVTESLVEGIDSVSYNEEMEVEVNNLILGLVHHGIA